MNETTPHAAESNGEHPKRCGAKTRSGDPCRNYGIPPSGRCRMHGAHSLRGPESPTWKHGLYSRHAGPQLKQVLDELQDVPTDELLNTDAEIKLLSALIVHCRAIEEAPRDLQTLESVSKVVERLVKSKQRGQMVMLQAMKLIPSSDVEAFLAHVDDVLFSELEGAQASNVSERVRSFRLPTPALKTPRKPSGTSNVLSDQNAA